MKQEEKQEFNKQRRVEYRPQAAACCALPNDEIWSLPKYHIWGRDFLHKED